MKRAFYITGILLLIIVLFLAGCQKPVTSPPETTPVQATTTPPETTETSVTTPTPTQVTVTPPSPTPTQASKTYYVKNGGNDTASGLSDAEAWSTLLKVQTYYFNPGDSIILKCGSTWNERLDFPSSGSPGNDILLSSYGSGAQPKIMRLHLSWKQYVTVTNIYMLADNDYEALWAEHCHDITIDGITADGQKIMNSNRYEVTTFRYSYNVTVKNSTIKDGGNTKDTIWGGGLGIDDGCHDFLIENNLVYNHVNFAIQTNSFSDDAPVYNVTIRGNTIYNEEGYWADCRGINIGWRSHDIIIENNKVSNTSTMLIGTDGFEHDVIIRNNLLFYTIDSGYASFIDILSYGAQEYVPNGNKYNSFVYNNSMFHLSRVSRGAFIRLTTLDDSTSTGHRIFNNLCVTYNPDVAFIFDNTIYDFSSDVTFYPNNIHGEGNPAQSPSEFTSDYNLYYSLVSPGLFMYRDVKYYSSDDWRRSSGQDEHSIFANPLLNGIENFISLDKFSTSGLELLSNTSFNYDTAGWGYYFNAAAGASGSFSRTTAAGEYYSAPAGLKMNFTANTSDIGHVLLFNNAGMRIESKKWYVLSFKAKASSQFRIPHIFLIKNQQPCPVYATEEMGEGPLVTTDWKTYYLFFYTNQAASDAEVSWFIGNSLPAGGTFYIDDVSFKLADGLN